VNLLSHGMPDVPHDRHYRNDLHACGAPFPAFARFVAEATLGTVLDLGCGQGRDALLFARAGHRVLGVDASSVGLEQMSAVARAEGLDLNAEVADLVSYRPPRTFDVVVLDRVLHMIHAQERMTVLSTAMDAVAPGGHLLVAEGPKGLAPVREAIETRQWSLPRATKNRLIARRPPA